VRLRPKSGPIGRIERVAAIFAVHKWLISIMHDEFRKKARELNGNGRYTRWRIYMGSVSSSPNQGVADLLQTLSNVNSPILNSPAAVKALESAPPSDIVQLSREATQLEGVDTLFGISSPSSSSSSVDTRFGLPTTTTSSPNNILTAMENEGATLTPAEQEANDQATAQSALTQGLFGTGPSTTGTLFNTLG
jgi:hypothetical protein